MAHSVPPAALTLGENGAVGVKVVDSDGVVSFVEVSASSASADSVWLVGLSPTIEIITVGQEFVTVGQKVDPVLIDTSLIGPIGRLPSTEVEQKRVAQHDGNQQ